MNLVSLLGQGGRDPGLGEPCLFVLSHSHRILSSGLIFSERIDAKFATWAMPSWPESSVLRCLVVLWEMLTRPGFWGCTIC